MCSVYRVLRETVKIIYTSRGGAWKLWQQFQRSRARLYVYIHLFYLCECVLALYRMKREKTNLISSVTSEIRSSVYSTGTDKPRKSNTLQLLLQQPWRRRRSQQASIKGIIIPGLLRFYRGSSFSTIIYFLKQTRKHLLNEHFQS